MIYVLKKSRYSAEIMTWQSKCVVVIETVVWRW